MSKSRPKHPDLLAEIEKFCKARKVSRSAFGKQALRDPRLVSDITAGRELRMETIAAIRDYMITGEARQERGAA